MTTAIRSPKINDYYSAGVRGNPDRKTLEDLWRQRLNDAKLRVDFARNFVLEVERDFPSSEIPSSDGLFAHEKAIRAENDALAEYLRVRRIYDDLILNRTIPDEAEWLKARGAKASGSESEDG